MALVGLDLGEARAGSRRVQRAEGDAGRRFIRVLEGRARRFLPRPECGDDAMLWKERYVSRTSALTKIVGGILYICVLGLLGYGVYEFAGPAFADVRRSGFLSAAYGPANRDFNGFLRVVATIVSTCWLIGVASQSASTMAGLARATLPRPPDSDTPPSTTAVSALISQPAPVSDPALLRRAA